MEHCLGVDLKRLPMKQKRSFAPERPKAIMDKVDKLLKAKFIQKVSYLDWIANMILIKNTNGK